MVVAMLLAGEATAQKTVSFPTEDGAWFTPTLLERVISSSCWPGQFNKESWDKQAHVLVAAGFEVLALDFRGYGKSKGPGDSDPTSAPLYVDVLSAVRFLRTRGAKTVSVVGASMGGWRLATRPLLRDRLR